MPCICPEWRVGRWMGDKFKNDVVIESDGQRRNIFDFDFIKVQ
jgi:hypothetical protein